jgi:hypothetical protein
LVYLWSALTDADVEAVLGIDAGGGGLIKAAIFGLGLPIIAGPANRSSMASKRSIREPSRSIIVRFCTGLPGCAMVGPL